MANLNRKWRRVMAVSCSHGDLVHPAIRKQVLEFVKRYRPEIRVELGDLIDTACFRNGAAGTQDEARSPRDDRAAAVKWIHEYAPTHLSWGNHDWRLFEAKDHPKAVVSELASDMWAQLNDAARKVKAKTVPYDIEDGWFYFGGYAWGHGFMINMQAVRDHAEMIGRPVVMGHLHAAQQVNGRTIKSKPSFCAGAMADERKLTYGRRRRNSLTHGHGVVFGEVSENDSHLWLAQSKNGEPIVFPPGV